MLYRLSKRPGISSTDMYKLFPADACDRSTRRVALRLRKFGYIKYGPEYFRSRMPAVRVIPLYVTEFGHSELRRYIEEMFEGELHAKHD